MTTEFGTATIGGDGQSYGRRNAIALKLQTRRMKNGERGGRTNEKGGF
jgi:hypothetical protein